MATALRDLREGAGMRREELAAAAGISVAGLAHIELGYRVLTVEKAAHLARALGVRGVDIAEAGPRIEELREQLAAVERPAKAAAAV